MGETVQKKWGEIIEERRKIVLKSTAKNISVIITTKGFKLREAKEQNIITNSLFYWIPVHTILELPIPVMSFSWITWTVTNCNGAIWGLALFFNAQLQYNSPKHILFLLKSSAHDKAKYLKFMAKFYTLSFINNSVTICSVFHLDLQFVCT